MLLHICLIMIVISLVYFPFCLINDHHQLAFLAGNPPFCSVSKQQQMTPDRVDDRKLSKKMIYLHGHLRWTYL